MQARSDAKTLLPLLKRVWKDVSTLEERAPFLNTGERTAVSDEARATAKALIGSATELRDVISSFKPQTSDEEDQMSDSDEDENPAALRERLANQSGTAMDAIKSVAASILPMLDPPPHTSIFGLDVLRGCVLSRYRGAQQFWVRRPSGGMIDVLYIPSVAAANDTAAATARNKRKAVLYCNPNAGLVEVAAGMSLAGGNVSPEEDNGNTDASWTDFYTENGYDMYLFNYAGFGRSHGANLCFIGNISPNAPGVLARLGRIFQHAFLCFKVSVEYFRCLSCRCLQ